jgi:acetyl esterase/lipase
MAESKGLDTARQAYRSLLDRTRNIPTVEEARLAYEEMFPVSLADDVERERVSVGGVPAERIVAPGADAGRVLLYLHGGGYAIGSMRTHRELISRLSRASAARGLGIDYRLAPEMPFPAAVEDTVTAYRWLLSTGVQASRIVIAGDSAGGGLTAAALVALRYLGEPLPAAGVCISPWVDMEGLGDSYNTNAKIDPMGGQQIIHNMARWYLGDRDRRTPLAAPIYADLSGLPPLLIQVGAAEVLLDDSVQLAERARAAGVDVAFEAWDDMLHVWHFFASVLPEGQQGIDRIGEFVRKHTG